MKNQLKNGKLTKEQLKINNKPFPMFSGNSANLANMVSKKAKEKGKTYWGTMPKHLISHAGNKAWNKHLAYLQKKGIKIINYAV